MRSNKLHLSHRKTTCYFYANTLLTIYTYTIYFSVIYVYFLLLSSCYNQKEKKICLFLYLDHKLTQHCWKKNTHTHTYTKFFRFFVFFGLLNCILYTPYTNIYITLISVYDLLHKNQYTVYIIHTYTVHILTKTIIQHRKTCILCIHSIFEITWSFIHLCPFHCCCFSIHIIHWYCCYYTVIHIFLFSSNCQSASHLQRNVLVFIFCICITFDCRSTYFITICFCNSFPHRNFGSRCVYVIHGARTKNHRAFPFERKTYRLTSTNCVLEKKKCVFFLARTKIAYILLFPQIWNVIANTMNNGHQYISHAIWNVNIIYTAHRTVRFCSGKLCILFYLPCKIFTLCCSWAYLLLLLAFASQWLLRVFHA